MIMIRFLVFLYNPNEERPQRLAVVTPPFTSPSTVKILLKTAKFEKQESLVVSGEKDSLEKLVSQVERLDLTDWLAIEEWQPLKEKITKLVESIEGLSVFDTSDDDSIVFGDEKEEVTASKNYPKDLPQGQEPLWDDVKEKYSHLLKGDKDKKEAILRKLYSETAKRYGMVPFSYMNIDSKKKFLIAILETGEKKAHTFLDKITKYLLSEKLIKRATGLKFDGNEPCPNKHSTHRLCHTLTWTLAKEKTWLDLLKYLTLKEAFNPLGPKLLVLKVNQNTEIEIYRNTDDKVTVSIVHNLSQKDLEALLGAEVSNPSRELNRLGKLWQEKGAIG